VCGPSQRQDRFTFAAVRGKQRDLLCGQQALSQKFMWQGRVRVYVVYPYNPLVFLVGEGFN